MTEFQNEFTYKRFLEGGKDAEFDKKFEDAVEKVKREALGKKVPMYINAKEVFAQEELVENSPIDGTLIGRFQKGTRQHAQQAIDAASAAFDSWSGKSYKERVNVFRNAAEILSKEKFVVAAILGIENGKSRYESIGEVDEAIDFMNYYADEVERNKGYSRKTKLTASTAKVQAGFQGAPGNEEKIVIAAKPYGVFGVLAPFNFPISISVGMSTGALITGNTVVFKPSSTDNMTLLTGLKIYEIFREAGMPDGVFNYLTGPGSELGDEFIANPKVSGIAFTGSRAVGMDMMKKASELGLQKVFVIEMGGKNPAIVAKDAEIDAAVEGIASAAYGFAGQKCSACSRVYVHDSIKEEFVSKLIDKLRTFKIGNPLKKEVYIGPLISPKALERYKTAIGEAKKSGKVLYGGNVINTGFSGAYVEPAIVEVDSSNTLMREELFVPILAIDTFKKFDEVLQKANDVEFGLTAGLYSRKNKEIKEFLSKIQAGVVYVNRRTSATTGAIVGAHTFVGWKGSGLTGKGTGSRFYLQQFFKEQSIAVVK